jgi:hypothetical protein
MVVVILSAAAVAQTSTPGAASTPTLTEEQIAAFKAEAKERQRQTLHPEVAHVRGVTGGVSVGVHCADGFITQQRVVPNASDVEIVATKRTDCDGSRCRGLEVLARRSEGPFDLDVEVTCSGS